MHPEQAGKICLRHRPSPGSAVSVLYAAGYGMDQDVASHPYGHWVPAVLLPSCVQNYSMPVTAMDGKVRCNHMLSLTCYH